MASINQPLLCAASDGLAASRSTNGLLLLSTISQYGRMSRKPNLISLSVHDQHIGHFQLLVEERKVFLQGNIESNQLNLV